MLSSGDRGRRWHKVRMPRKALLAEVDFVTARTGFALGQNGRMWMTRDRGRHWHDLGGDRQRRRHRHVLLRRPPRIHRAVALRRRRARLHDAHQRRREDLEPAAADRHTRSARRRLRDSTRHGHRALGRDITALHRARGRRRTPLDRPHLGPALGAPRRARESHRPRERRCARHRGAGVAPPARRERVGLGDRRWWTRTAASRPRAGWQKTASFVAQWPGDEDQAGDGSAPLVVRTRR